MEEHDEATFAEAVLGEDAQVFWKSDLGQWVIARSLKESEDATNKLRQADPEDAKVIRDLQNDIKNAEQALIWIDEAIRNGKQAIQELEGVED